MRVSRTRFMKTVCFHHKFYAITWRADNIRPYGSKRKITKTKNGWITFFVNPTVNFLFGNLKS